MHCVELTHPDPEISGLVDPLSGNPERGLNYKRYYLKSKTYTAIN